MAAQSEGNNLPGHSSPNGSSQFANPINGGPPTPPTLLKPKNPRSPFTKANGSSDGISLLQSSPLAAKLRADDFTAPHSVLHASCDAREPPSQHQLPATPASTGQTPSFTPGQINYQLVLSDERATRALAHMALVQLGPGAARMVEVCARKLESLQALMDSTGSLLAMRVRDDADSFGRHSSTLSNPSPEPRRQDMNCNCTNNTIASEAAACLDRSEYTNKRLFLLPSIALESQETARAAERAVIRAVKDQQEVINSGMLVQHRDRIFCIVRSRKKVLAAAVIGCVPSQSPLNHDTVILVGIKNLQQVFSASAAEFEPGPAPVQAAATVPAKVRSSAANQIQAWWRRLEGLQQELRRCSSASLLQALCRGRRAREVLDAHHQSATKIQAAWRSLSGRRYLARLRIERISELARIQARSSAATQIQAWWRVRKEMQEVRRLRSGSFASLLQGAVRRHLQLPYGAARSWVVRIQALWRGRRERRSLDAARRLAITIQTAWRANRARNLHFLRRLLIVYESNGFDWFPIEERGPRYSVLEQITGDESASPLRLGSSAPLPQANPVDSDVQGDEKGAPQAVLECCLSDSDPHCPEPDYLQWDGYPEPVDTAGGFGRAPLAVLEWGSSNSYPLCSEQDASGKVFRNILTSDHDEPVRQMQGSTGSAGLIAEGSAIISKCNNDLRAGQDQPWQVGLRMPSASDSDMQCRQTSEQDGLVTLVASDEQGVEQNDPKSLCATVLSPTVPSDHHEQLESDFEQSLQERVRLFAPFLRDSVYSLHLNERESDTLNFLLGIYIVKACSLIYGNDFGHVKCLEQKFRDFTALADICPKANPTRPRRADNSQAEWAHIRAAEKQRAQQALDGMLAWQVVPGRHKSQGSHPATQLTRQNRGGAGSADLSGEGTALLAKTNNHLCLSKSRRPDRAEGTAGSRREVGSGANQTSPPQMDPSYDPTPQGGRRST